MGKGTGSAGNTLELGALDRGGQRGLEEVPHDMASPQEGGVPKAKTRVQPGLGSASKASKAEDAQSSVGTERTFADSIESAAVRQILQSFPTSEMLARNISVTNWAESLFVPNQSGDMTYVTVPHNIEEYRDSLMMMSILKLYEAKRWVPSLSSTSLPRAVLETKEASFFAGFVSASLRRETGECETGSTKYARGIRSFQTFSVEKAYGRARHLKTGGLDNITEKLSSMKGFTKEFWGLRGAIVTLFKSVNPARVTRLDTFVKSREELLKVVKTRLQSENGGCFRPEELRFLSERYQSTKQELNTFLGRLEHPNEELAQHFDELYAPIKTNIDRCDNEIKANLASRARILFPNSNKKGIQRWLQKSLVEKLSDLSEDKLKEFLPETLPGITAQAIEIVGEQQQRFQLITRRYHAVGDPTAQEVIASWYANFDSSLGED